MRLPALVGLLLTSESSATAQDMSDARRDFFDEVRRSPIAQGGSWLETKNALGDWEKIILVFGFADPGDHAACESIKDFAAAQNPTIDYRCNPVE